MKYIQSNDIVVRNHVVLDKVKCCKCWKEPKEGEGMYTEDRYLVCERCHDELLKFMKPYTKTLYTMFFHNTCVREDKAL